MHQIKYLYALILSLLLMPAAGCGNRGKTITVGMAILTTSHISILDGFKAGMAEYGYVDGKNIRYIYNGLLEDNPAAIDREIGNLLSQDVDLLLTGGNMVSLRAKKAVEGTDVPIIIGASSRPVEEGLVDSLQRPGGNITGVRTADSIPKMLELLAMVVPDKRKFYLPYNPDDQVSVVSLKGLAESAAKMGIELVIQEIRSVEEAVSSIKTLPRDIGAIYRLPSPTLDSRNSELTMAALERGLPIGSVLPLDESVLLVLASDPFATGRQAARLADLIIKGAKPADLPVETADAYLTVNLRTAKKLGIGISNDILALANNIIH
ncbi:MAG: ABC transporter substrate-binding protein [Deltaproteobacteria bacterium]|nr:ABC transporter substrate-binding protein [Deltaproteobacteria bacterium]